MNVSTIEEIVKLASNYGISLVLAIILIIIVIRDKNRYQKIITDTCKKAVEQSIPKHPDSKRYNQYDSAYATLHAVLERTRVTMNAARICVIMYHNGGQNLVGIPFQKMSVISEVVAPGIARIMDSFQSVQRGSYVVLHQKLQADRYWLIPDISEIDSTLVTYSLLTSHSTESACFIQVRDILNDLPIGFICIEYMHPLAPEDRQGVLDTALDLGDTVSAIMGVDREESHKLPE